MKWLTLAGILLYLTRHSDAGALKCTPESQDPSCASEKRDILPVQSIVRREKETAPADTECLAGSEWESNCHKCHCTESGVAVCLKDDSCDFQVYDEPIRCKPYSTFQRDCNVCTCLKTGLGLCTLKSCTPLVRRKRNSMQCKPGSTWKNSCNACECHSTGVATCTRMECWGDTSERHTMQCQPGSTWKNNCNDCKCRSNGVPICTIMECSGDSSGDNKVCSPGTEWTDDCNTCHCTSDGAPKCTELKCSTRQKRHSMQCQPGSAWKNSCNACRCLPNGFATCTRMECSGDSSEDNKVCSPGTEWNDDCNTCHCTSDGVPKCTDLKCSTRQKRHSMQCKPGSTWKNSCNACQCHSTGVATCTKMGCLDDSSEDLFNWESNKVCSPGTEWTDDCNTCHCTSQGAPNCTELKCSTRQKRHSTQCKPGSTWNNSCNKCRCLSSGEAACTTMVCPGDSNDSKREKRDTSKTITKETQNHSIAKRGVCKPNQEFQIDCNPCKCAANGLSYTCTHNECLEGDNLMNKEVEIFMESEGTDHVERHSVCKPHDTFYIGCNTCHCNVYGTDYSCTNKPCPLPADVELFHELKESTTISSNKTKQVVCVANRMFIKDCNTCWCNEDGTGFFCTRRVCTPDSTDEIVTEAPGSEVKLRVVKLECRPNEVFELDCNMCRCNADGKSFSCTRRACADFEEKNSTLIRRTRAGQETAKACQPGQEFRLDCNKCLCNDEGQDFSCTRIDCASLNNNGGGGAENLRTKREISDQVKTEQCEPGSLFYRECNYCRCTKDGMHATCTMKLCKKETVKEAEPEQSFRCTPGEQFKKDCRDCTCSADGKTIYCTLRLCDQVLTDV